MYSIAPDHAVGSEALWVSFLARRELADAISILERAGAALIPMLDDSDWQSDGLRALHDLLARLRDDTGVELGHLQVREWELAAGGGA